MTRPLASSRAAPLTGIAEVRAHDRVVRYRRAGTVGPVLLLLASDSTTDLWPELPRLLADHFRLMIPDLGVQSDGAAASLRCLLDGLGGVGVPVIAAGKYCDAALELALEGNESVGRMVLVPEMSEDAGDAEGAQPRAAARRLPVEILRRNLPVDEALERVMAFLRAPS